MATVLIVESSKLLQKAMSQACESLGVTAEVRSDVPTALAAIAKNKPIAVLTSFELPSFSGSVLIAALRSSPYHRAIPVALVTSSDPRTSHMDIQVPDATIVKDSDLSGSVVRFLKSFHVGQDLAAKQSNATAPKLSGKILLAEDAKMIQRLLGKILHVAGADVTVVEDGAKAVAMVSEQAFDLILMDIEMPVMDGREATRRLRAEGCEIPILATTAHDIETFRIDALQAGFDDVLPKPVSRDILVNTCREHLAQATQHRAGCHAHSEV